MKNGELPPMALTPQHHAGCDEAGDSGYCV